MHSLVYFCCDSEISRRLTDNTYTCFKDFQDELQFLGKAAYDKKVAFGHIIEDLASFITPASYFLQAFPPRIAARTQKWGETW